MNYWRKINQIQIKINSLSGQERKDYCNKLLKSNPKIFEELKKNPYYIIDGKFGGLYDYQDVDKQFEDYNSVFFLGGRAAGKTLSSCQYVKIWVDYARGYIVALRVAKCLKCQYVGNYRRVITFLKRQPSEFAKRPKMKNCRCGEK